MRMLFLRISNRYSGFAYDDFKVKDWCELLEDVSFDRAMENLRRYSRNPENTFPPHPGILAELTVQNSIGPYIPDASETRLMLEERDRMLMSGDKPPIPDSARERMRLLGYSKSSATGRE